LAELGWQYRIPAILPRRRILLPLAEPIMRGPKPVAVELSDEQRDALHALVRRHSAPQQLALRAQLLLAAAEGRSNSEIARAFQVSRESV
jgi:DNA-directed RNA polymerase specialized sigma24 family protein